MAKRYKFRELVRALLDLDKRFEVIERRGKGSHRMIYHPDIGGRPASFPIVFKSDGSELNPKYIKGIIRRFCLPDGAL